MKRKGFTLVELLIVIVVIGILSAMMIISSTEAVTSAKANNIVSNLRNFKTAVLSYYADNMDAFNNESNGRKKTIETSDILPYLRKTNSNLEQKETLNGYWIVNVDGVFYVGCDLDNGAITANTEEAKRVAKKLEGRAKTTGIMFSTELSKISVGDLTYTVPSTLKGVVMWVR